MQRIIIAITCVGAAGVLVLSALDWRFGWSTVPTANVVLGDILVIAGLMIDLWVLSVNTYGASTVKTMEGQRVISTGPYALVRHPMYVGVVILMIGVPLALGSYWGLLFLLLIIPILMWRIVDEEAMLRQELPGYQAYMGQVRHRLVPFVW